jgi:short-subunit dehydrogenase
MLFNSLQLEVLPFNIYVTNIMPGDIKTAFTQNRQKNTLEEGVYFERMKRSLAVMERDEQNGMPPQAVANLVLKAAKARRPKLNMVVGTRYRILDFLMKILPESLVKAIIYKIYG